VDVLEYRAEHHDESKLNDEIERPIFEMYTPVLPTLEFGGEAYKQALASMGDGLKQHYRNNAHHPEQYANGIEGMTLYDVMEMVADWMAAASKKGSSIDLAYLSKRFGISEQLCKIIENTLWAADMDNVNYRIPPEFAMSQNFLSYKWDKKAKTHKLSPNPYKQDD